MPHYFFHVQNQTSYTRDETGAELADEHAARYRAATAAGEILTSDLQAEKDDVRFEIQIDDSDGHRVATMTISGMVEPRAPA